MLDPAKLPTELTRAIFHSDVVRAVACSVSIRWHKIMLAVSQYYNSTYLYNLTGRAIFMTSEQASTILGDYHLTSRLGTSCLFNYQMEMCIAGNQAVYELFVRYNKKPSNADILLSRNPWFQTQLDDKQITINSIRLMYMLSNGYVDALRNPKILLTCSCYDDDNLDGIINAAMMSSAGVHWFIEHRGICYELICVVMTRNMLDIALTLQSQDYNVIKGACRYGTIEMYLLISKTNPINIEIAITEAFQYDNINLFDYLAKSVPNIVSTFTTQDAFACGSPKCALRVLKPDDDLVALINYNIDYENIDYDFIVANFNVPQHILNDAFIRVAREYNPKYDQAKLAQYQRYATNYDVDVYKNHSIVVII